MRCQHCGGLVLWMGPLVNLTHTQCQSCGCVNCQEPEPETEEEATGQETKEDK